MDTTTAVGVIAGVLTTAGNIPQVIKPIELETPKDCLSGAGSVECGLGDVGDIRRDE
ncbi:MAG: hypothetical protein NVS1B11_35020 [Terriglobales bacterium]